MQSDIVTIIQQSAMEVIALVDEADIGNVRRAASRHDLGDERLAIPNDGSQTLSPCLFILEKTMTIGSVPAGPDSRYIVFPSGDR